MAKPSMLGAKLGPSFKTYWTKSGPDCIALEPGQTLEIFTKDEQMRLVRLVTAEGQVLLEMSGEVVVEPDEHTAQSFQVDVEDPELQAFGTYSRWGVICGFLILLLWHVLRWVVSIKLEQSAQHGQYVWWRGTLVLLNGLLFCALGLWQSWALSLSGEADLELHQKLLATVLVILWVMALASTQLADYPLSALAVPALLSGPFLQYYQTQKKYPERRFLPCVSWIAVHLLGTAGISGVLIAILVGYRALLAASRPVSASFFLPVSTSLVESFMVTYTRQTCETLVVRRRPLVPGDVSLVAIPHMMSAIHGFAEAARLVGIFSGTLKSGEYTWAGALAVGLVMNVLARCGWTRFFAYCMLKRLVGLPSALVLAPSAYGKLFDEIKIYVGYFRFPAVLALLLARGIVYQDFSLSGPHSAAFNASALCALLCMLLAENVEDFIVVQQIVPMSPVLSEFVDTNLHSFGRHGSLLSMDLRVQHGKSVDGGPESPGDAWRMEELDQNGRKRIQHAKSKSSAVKMSSILPSEPQRPEPENPGHSPLAGPPASPAATCQMGEGRARASRLSLESEERVIEKPSGSRPSVAPPPPEEEADGSPVPSLQPLPLGPSERLSVSVMNMHRQISQRSVRDSGDDTQVVVIASLGECRHSSPSRIRRWFGQQRSVHPSLLLHGLRAMPFACQLAPVAALSEATLCFLNTAVGPGFLRGLRGVPCEDSEGFESLWWPCPMVC